MDEKYYSPKAVDDFAKEVICLGKSDMYTAWKNNDPVRWRKLLVRHKATNDQVEKMLNVVITDAMRPIIHSAIRLLTKKLLPLGELIVSGGEAFNFYSPREHRIVTSDIDTKFVPGYKFGQKRTFLNYQSTRILIWDQMETLRAYFNPNIRRAVGRLVRSKAGRFLGISKSDSKSPLTRRYTRKAKERKNTSTNKVSEGDTLSDIEVFALDLNVKWFHPEQRKRVDEHMGGLLDVVLLRRGEMGSAVWDDRLYLKDQKIMVAGKKYLIEDLYLLNKLGLRKSKAEKDRKRLYLFCKHILGIPGVRSSMSVDSLYKHIKPRIAHMKAVPRKRIPFNSKVAFDNAMKVNPLRNERVGVSKPSRNKSMQLALSVKAPRGLKIPGYKETAGNVRFNEHTLRWKRNKSLHYIHDEYTHKVNKNAENKIPLNGIQKIRIEKTLVGYNPQRDSYIPVEFVRKAALIKYAGMPQRDFVI